MRIKIRVLSAFSLLAGLFLMSTVSAGDVTTSIVTGQFVVKAGGMLAGGQAFFFNEALGPAPSEQKYWRIPDHVVALDGQGRFSVELPAGKYYIGAIKRSSGEQHFGPPEEGDLFVGRQGSQGKQAPPYHIRGGEKTDLGVFPGAMPFKRSTVQYGEGITSIGGAIHMPDGKPVEGALVFGYLNANMVGRPLFVSDRTGKDGTFILRVNSGGRYYLKVRDVYGGGPPAPGSLIGAYGQEKPTEVMVRDGEKISGIMIQAIRFPGRGPKRP